MGVIFLLLGIGCCKQWLLFNDAKFFNDAKLPKKAVSITIVSVDWNVTSFFDSRKWIQFQQNYHSVAESCFCIKNIFSSISSFTKTKILLQLQGPILA
jgi:hypothetical protein